MVRIEMYEHPLAVVGVAVVLLLQVACGMSDEPPPSPPTDEGGGDEQPSGTRDADLDRQLRRLLRENEVRPPRREGPYDQKVVELGRNLFFDKALSASNDIACATCHHHRGGANTDDNLPLAIGTGGVGNIPERRFGNAEQFVPRNAIGLFNLDMEGVRVVFWDGRLERAPGGELVTPRSEHMPEGLDGPVAAQAMLPVLNRLELRGPAHRPAPLSQIPDDRPAEVWASLMDRLLGYEGYRELFREAYPETPLQELEFRDAANAIAKFEKTAFTYLDSPFDRYLRGEDDALDRTQKLGARVFYGKGGCANCHAGGLTTDQEFHNIAAPQIGPGKAPMKPLDPGRYIVTGRPAQLFDFRTPRLRNVELTAPYMHSGAYETLEAAIKHHLDAPKALRNYDGSHMRPSFREAVHNGPGVREQLLRHLDGQMRTRASIQRQPGHPLRVTETDVDRLVAFLKSMTSPQAKLQLGRTVPVSVPSGLLEDGIDWTPARRISARRDPTTPDTPPEGN